MKDREDHASASRAARSEDNGSGEIQDAETLRQTRSSPVVRRLAEEHGLEIAQIPGSGTGGRVTRKDIEGFIEEGGAEREAKQEEPAAAGSRGPTRAGTRARLRG